MSQSPAEVATTPAGDCVIRLIGRGTMQHSPAVQELVVQTLQRDAATRVAIDLAGCTYLDSTFLGSLFGIYQRYGGERPQARLKLHAPAATIKTLFGSLKLDRYIKADPSPAPPTQGTWVPLEAQVTDNPQACSRHVMECHRRLAEMDTPAKAAFAKIADAMERDLGSAAGM